MKLTLEEIIRNNKDKALSKTELLLITKNYGIRLGIVDDNAFILGADKNIYMFKQDENKLYRFIETRQIYIF